MNVKSLGFEAVAAKVSCATALALSLAAAPEGVELYHVGVLLLLLLLALRLSTGNWYNLSAFVNFVCLAFLSAASTAATTCCMAASCLALCVVGVYLLRKNERPLGSGKMLVPK